MNETVESFKALNVNVVAISYDSVAKNKEFSEEHKLSYPLLSDTGFRTVKALGILNDSVPTQSPAYGIAYPGVLYVSPEGKVLLKRAEEGYKVRPSLDELIEAVKALQE